MIYWIDCPGPGRLATMARPRAGDWLEDEIARWRDDGLSLVVSLLEDHEIAELGLQEEPTLCQSSGIEFARLPIVDRGVPDSLMQASELADDIARRVSAGQSIAIHCRAGIGRSSLLAALVLRKLGRDTATAFADISNARGLDVPDTSDQRQWVEAWR